jgi:hypothetical protein
MCKESLHKMGCLFKGKAAVKVEVLLYDVVLLSKTLRIFLNFIYFNIHGL